MTDRSKKAADWRKRHNLSIDELADLTGYSREAIYLMERDVSRRDGKKPARVKDWVWKRWQMACAGVEAQLVANKEFDWGES